MRVSNPSSFRICSLRRAFRILRVVLIHRSQIPPWCDAAGGSKIQRTSRQQRLASSRHEPAKSVYETICIKRVRDFDVDGSDRQTLENTALPLHLTSFLLHHKWAKVVDPKMTERRLSGCNTFLRKICHLLTTHRSLSPSAAETISE